MYGPVVKKVYDKYKFFGGGAIILPENNDFESLIPYSDREHINSMLDTTATYSTNFLIEATHRQDPWSKAYVKGQGNIISKESISKYFNSNGM